MKDKKGILFDKRFFPMFLTQFLGAFNDNIFKNALVILITFKSYSLLGLDPKQMVALCGGIFILPFFLFSAWAGQIAEKISKSKFIIWIKVWEIFVMIIGAVGFYFDNVIILIITLFFMGLQSTFFGPAKYSILPELIPRKKLVSGNAYFEFGTFIAILLGTILAGLIIAIPETGRNITAFIVIFIAILGCVTSLKLPKLEPVAPEVKVSFNIIRPTIEIIKIAKKQKTSFLAILGISWFWFLGSAFLSILPPYCKDFLQMNESFVTISLALFTVGVAIGSLFCGKLSFEQLELGLVPIGSIGMSLFLFDLSFISQPAHVIQNIKIPLMSFVTSWTGIHIMIDFFLFSLFSGFFIVPLYTLIQDRTPKKVLSRVVAANNIINALFMIIAAVFLIILFSLKLSIPQVILSLAIVNVVVAVYIYTLLPEFLFRFVSWMTAHFFYRLKVSSASNVPGTGPALLIANHMTFIDWLIISSSTQRPIRFVYPNEFFEKPVLGKIMKAAKLISVSDENKPELIYKSATQKIKSALAHGDLVCIFPEAKITETGTFDQVHPDYLNIINECTHPVIPMKLTGLWGSFFSKKYGNAFSTPKALFKTIFKKINLNVGEPLKEDEQTTESIVEIMSNL
jgi:1-acyl-sn-glycerol-3-phosphate acyltransferase